MSEQEKPSQHLQQVLDAIPHLTSEEIDEAIAALQAAKPSPADEPSAAPKSKRAGPPRPIEQLMREANQ